MSIVSPYLTRRLRTLEEALVQCGEAPVLQEREVARREAGLAVAATADKRPDPSSQTEPRK
jgi:hypothetical protein